MNHDPDTSNDVGNSPPLGDWPDWDQVPFAVSCPRCGTDVFGLCDANCPTCALDLDWHELVPLEELTCLHCGYHLCGLPEARCPECGNRFTWTEVTADYHHRKRPLFEYQWRRGPIRLFLSTWLMSFRPRKLWRLIDIHSPPNLKPLMVMVAVTLVVFAIVLPLCSGIVNYLLWWSWLRGWVAPRDFWTAVLQFFREIVSAAFDPDVHTSILVGLIWCATSLATLFVFIVSMHPHKVRAVHVLRVWAYSVPLKLAPIPVMFSAVFIVDRHFEWLSSKALFAIVLGPMLIHVVSCLPVAYVSYLRMRHAWAVAISLQIVAILGWMVICDLFIPDFLYGL